jgi:hypothetical protein
MTATTAEGRGTQGLLDAQALLMEASAHAGVHVLSGGGAERV